jgi:hypothetical protein
MDTKIRRPERGYNQPLRHRRRSGQHGCLDVRRYKVPNEAEKIIGNRQRSTTVRFSSDFVPQGTEVVLQSRKSIFNAEFGNALQDSY